MSPEDDVLPEGVGRKQYRDGPVFAIQDLVVLTELTTAAPRDDVIGLQLADEFSQRMVCPSPLPSRRDPYSKFSFVRWATLWEIRPLNRGSEHPGWSRVHSHVTERDGLAQLDIIAHPLVIDGLRPSQRSCSGLTQMAAAAQKIPPASCRRDGGNQTIHVPRLSCQRRE